MSAVSAVAAVRAHLVDLQRTLAGDGGAVLEGRDIATAVMPDAVVKVYLDASPEVRAGRRAGEQLAGASAGGAPGGHYPSSLASVADDLARRDHLDSSRTADPLRAAPDAVHLDSSELDADAVVEHVLRLVRDAGLIP